MSWKKICGNKVTFTNGEVDAEQIRIREIMEDYQLSDIYNFDESRLCPEHNGNYSYHSPNVPNIGTGNSKKHC